MQKAPVFQWHTVLNTCYLETSPLGLNYPLWDRVNQADMRVKFQKITDVMKCNGKFNKDFV